MTTGISKLNIKYLLLTFIFILINLSLLGQKNGAVKGFVYDKETGEPCVFANVIIKGTALGTTTDINGYFTINKIPDGKYTLIIQILGYKNIEEEIIITSERVLSKKYYMESLTVMIDEVVISTEKVEMQTQVKASIIKITPAQIKQLPSIGSEPDLAQYLQVLPGVNFTGDQGGQLYIRGGSNIQNLVLLDGMVIYNPFHSIGLFSVFDSDIIRNADVYTGGFNVEYGGRVSSVMDIVMKDGNPNRFGGKLSTSTFGGKLMLEGPIIKNKNGNSMSFITSAKTSFLEKTSKTIYPYVNDGNGLPYSYNDFYGKLSINMSGGSKLDFFGFSFNDKVNYQEMSPIDWNSFGLGGNFIIVPPGSTTILEANAAFSNYKIKTLSENELPCTSGILGFNFGLNAKYFFGKNQLVWGLSALVFSTDYKFYNALSKKYEQDKNSTEFAFFLKYKWHLGNLIIEPGIRLQGYASLGKFSPEPRIGVKYNITEYVRLKVAAGLYSQNLVAANSDKDVVNLFYGFLCGDLPLQSNFKEKQLTNKLQKSQHVIAGFELDIIKNLNINIEGYLKNFSHIIGINRNKIFTDNADNAWRPEEQKKDFLMESGYAYGVDFLVKYDKKDIYIWFVYSLGWVKRKDVNGMLYLPHYDRRHNINLVTTYKFGKNKSWDISGRWNLGSGFPFTKTQGYYESPNIYEGLNYPYWSANGTLEILYDDYNKGRLPYFHRLDLTISKSFTFKKNMKLEINISVINVYNRKNIFYFERSSFKRINQLPVLPSFGLNFSF